MVPSEKFMVWSFLLFFFSFFTNNTEMKIILMITLLIISKLNLVSSEQFESNYFYLDSLSLSMSHLSIILSSFTLVIYMMDKDKKKEFLCLVSGISAFLLFHCNNLFSFFILFEFSLVPLTFLIISWGKQPERILAGRFIMFYTLFSSFPLFCFIIFKEEMGMMSMNNPLTCSDYQPFSLSWPFSMNFLVSLSFYLAFLVKVPIFFFHSWLPKAHVEAPLEGSIILAGIMLKVGTYGILRLFKMFPSESVSEINKIIFSISVLGSIISVLMAVSSDDLKLSIALSSISHMNFLLSSIVLLQDSSINMASFIMVSHGFSSSILFFFVSIIYELNKTRSMVITKGSMSESPSILLCAFLFFSLSISLPPSLPFLGEMIVVSSIWSFSTESIFMVILFILFNSFFSMMTYGMTSQSAKTKKLFILSPFELTFNLTSSLSLFVMVVLFFFPESII